MRKPLIFIGLLVVVTIVLVAACGKSRIASAFIRKEVYVALEDGSTRYVEYRLGKIRTESIRYLFNESRPSQPTATKTWKLAKRIGVVDWLDIETDLTEWLALAAMGETKALQTPERKETIRQELLTALRTGDYSAIRK